jgi:hypothetical protein
VNGCVERIHQAGLPAQGHRARIRVRNRRRQQCHRAARIVESPLRGIAQLVDDRRRLTSRRQGRRVRHHQCEVLSERIVEFLCDLVLTLDKGRRRLPRPPSAGIANGTDEEKKDGAEEEKVDDKRRG